MPVWNNRFFDSHFSKERMKYYLYSLPAFCCLILAVPAAFDSPPPVGSITKLVLYDADSDAVITAFDPLLSGHAIDTALYGDNFSIVAEWVPIVSGFARTTTFGNANRFDSWGTALEIATAGHVFQVLVTNSVGLATDQYLRGGDLDIQEGEVRLGFNIFRILN